MHKDASYYDAFWMETCVGQNLAQYFHDAFEEDAYWFEEIGGPIIVDGGIAFRYSAHERAGSRTDRAIFNGAEVLILRENKIFTVSDYYCDPHRSNLQAVARLAVKRHGATSYAQSGLGAQRTSRFRNKLSSVMDKDRVYLDPDLTLSQLADLIGCPINHLSQVINTEFQTHFHNFLDQYRAGYAKDLLLEESDDPKYVKSVASRSGFRSIEKFNSSFRKLYGVTAAEYHRHNAKEIEPTDKPLSN